VVLENLVKMTVRANKTEEKTSKIVSLVFLRYHILRCGTGDFSKSMQKKEK